MTESVNSELSDGVYYEFRPTNESLTVSVYRPTPDGTDDEVFYSADLARDFYKNQQKRRTLVNRVVESLPADADAEAAEEELEAFCDQLSYGLKDEVKEQLKPPVVQDLRRQTEKVVFVPGEELRIRVTLAVDGMERTLEFSAAEWNANSPKPLRDRYLNEFYEKIELEAEHWNDLVDYWSERKEIAEREELTQREQAAEDVLRRLRSSKLKVYDERGRIEAPESTWNAFYDDENEVEDAKVPDEKTVVWVRSDTIREILDDEGHGSGYVGELSHVLREKSAMLTKSRKKGLVTRVYPFEPEAVGITDPELQVIYPDDDGGVEI